MRHHERSIRVSRARARVLVQGRVQGVWFRGCTRDTARRLGLGGWVRNLPDGSVEAVFEGLRSSVEEAVSWCHQGPPSARVTRCDVEWEDPEGEGTFQILYS